MLSPLPVSPSHPHLSPPFVPSFLPLLPSTSSSSPSPSPLPLSSLASFTLPSSPAPTLYSTLFSHCRKVLRRGRHAITTRVAIPSSSSTSSSSSSYSSPSSSSSSSSSSPLLPLLLSSSTPSKFRFRCIGTKLKKCKY
ncbi:hypothetical protein SprV_0702294600 [Sparganum proliferum]